MVDCILVNLMSIKLIRNELTFTASTEDVGTVVLLLDSGRSVSD